MNLTAEAKEWKPKIGWMGPWGGIGLWNQPDIEDGRTGARLGAWEAECSVWSAANLWLNQARSSFLRYWKAKNFLLECQKHDWFFSFFYVN